MVKFIMAAYPAQTIRPDLLDGLPADLVDDSVQARLGEGREGRHGQHSSADGRHPLERPVCFMHHIFGILLEIQDCMNPRNLLKL